MFLAISLGCQKDGTLEPGEVEATITGFVIADNWGKGCSSGGLEIKIDHNTYIIRNAIAPEYEEANSWPVPVWVRYQAASPDACTESTNRITSLSIRRPR